MSEPLTTDELHERLERHVLGPEGQGRRAFLTKEVQLAGRRADAIAVFLWASRGQPVEGFELKTNRRDWLNELEDHGKAEPAMKICDRFWLVTNPDVLMPGELPDNWGLLVSTGRRRKLRIDKPAPLLRENEDRPLDRDAMVGILRALEGTLLENAADLRQDGIAEGEKNAKHRDEGAEARIERLEDENAELRSGHDAFVEAAGLNPYTWRQSHPERMKLLAEVAQALDDGDGGLKRLYSTLARIESTAGDLTGRINDAMGELNARIHGKGQAP